VTGGGSNGKRLADVRRGTAYFKGNQVGRTDTHTGTLNRDAWCLCIRKPCGNSVKKGKVPEEGCRRTALPTPPFGG
jgi:hypothetical protein